MSAAPIVLAVVSDVHAGSTVAPCPPEGLRLEDGGTVLPSKAQNWLWECWEDYWRAVADVRQAQGASLGVLCNGDACDGIKHGTHQSVSPTMEGQFYVMQRVFSVPQALKPDWWVFTKGTPSHVGNNAEVESSLAKMMGGERDPATGGWTWYHWEAELHGVRISARHHGRTGGRPWTMASAAGILATEIFIYYAREGKPHPHLAFRSHKHTAADSFDDQPVRVISTQAWQLHTEFTHKVVPEPSVMSAVGGLIVVIQPDGTYEVIKKRYRPDPTPLWRPAA